MRFTTTLITALFFVLVFDVSTVAAQGIFGGGGGGGSSDSSEGIFGNLQDRIQDIFDSLNVGVSGGAIIPGVEQPQERNARRRAGPDLPPSASSVKQVRLSLEWDSLSLGGEVAEPMFEDPLLGEDNPYGISAPHTNPWGLEDLRSDYLKCPTCGGGSAFNSVVVDQYNRVLPAVDGKVLSASPPGEPPRPNPPPPGGSVVSPWHICPQQTFCLIADVERVLTGWCGQDPNFLNEDRVPEITRDSQPGPNMFALPNAVSNKYVRRDGYAYKCISSCADGSCVTENYVEFQTMIYPSNAISMYARVENPTERVIDDVLVRMTTLSNSPSGEYPIPHNVDFPIEEALISGSASVVNTNGFSYSHGSTLGAKVDSGLDVLRTIPSGEGTVDIAIRRNTELESQQPEFQFGPFDLQPGEVKDIPLQPITTEFTRIPDTLGSYDLSNQQIGLLKPATPCECQGVRLHRGRNDDPDCNTVVTNPTDEQCRLYYGIGTPIPDHAGGYICDQGGITVPGCPPPWCFERPPNSPGYTGPLELCPNGIIPLPADWDNELDPWYYNVDYSNVDFNYDYEQGGIENGFTKLLKEILPTEVSELYFPPKAYGYGCTQPCQNDPPPGLSGIGGIIPRDYNFICDPDDRIADGSAMHEEARCTGTDPQVLIHPDDDRFQTYRDVTGIGGCGYYASSDNSVIGPVQLVAEYGSDEDGGPRTSRSILVGSIPVGGRILDDQARPFGWPITGEVEELWGPTSLADSNPGRANPTWDYGEYRYCAVGQN